MTEVRDFTYVANVVESNLLADTLEVVYWILLNCAYEGQITLDKLVAAIKKLFNINIEPIYDEPRAGNIKHSYADIELIINRLNFKPKFSFEDELKLTI